MTLSTGILDDFEREDDATTIGGDWSILGRISGGYDGGIADGCAYNPDGEWNYLVYDAAQFGPDCEVYVSLATLQPQTKTIMLFLRLTDVTPDAWQFDGYRIFASRFNNGGVDTMQFRLARVDNIVVTHISAPFNLANPADGLKFGISAVGSLIRGYYDTGAGWVQCLSAIDETYSGPGYFGLYLDSESTSRLDDFGGGEFLPVAVDGSLAAAGAAVRLPVKDLEGALPTVGGLARHIARRTAGALARAELSRGRGRSPGRWLACYRPRGKRRGRWCP